MQRTYVLNSRVMFTPGEEDVLIPVQCVTLLENGDHVNDRQEYVTAKQTELLALEQQADSTQKNWGDGPIRAVALAKLQSTYPADTIEVITIAEWTPRWDAIAKERAANKEQALKDAQDAIAKAASLQ